MLDQRPGAGCPPHSKAQVYVIDDDPEIQSILTALFSGQGYEVAAFSSGTEALEAFERIPGHLLNGPGLIVCDLKLPDLDGLRVIEETRKRGIGYPVILITAHATVETAVEALNLGAFDYITKPVHLRELITISGRALEHWQLQNNYRALREQLTNTTSVGKMSSRNRKMQAVFERVAAVAKANSNVLISGESGTGKEMVARAIHAQSSRAEHPFLAINCSAIPENLLESELFGHKKGSFTGASETRKGLFEEASGGTVFLDEIGDMPQVLQTKLLRVLQERKIKPVGENRARDIDVRIVAATHRDLRKAIDAQEFREDLYYRLCVVPIDLPPLRERREDIVPLVEEFLSKYRELNGVPRKHFSKAAIAKLLRLEWKGNVRELENAVERAVVLSKGDLIGQDDVQTENNPSSDSFEERLFGRRLTLHEMQQEYIEYILTETGNRKEKAAEILGINRKTLYRRGDPAAGFKPLQQTYVS